MNAQCPEEPLFSSHIHKDEDDKHTICQGIENTSVDLHIKDVNSIVQLYRKQDAKVKIPGIFFEKSHIRKDVKH